jgi:ABC-type lipoprotein export system ATPase subunit
VRRTLTRLRLDDANFDAVMNAVLFNPKARCKAEGVLPVSYPRVLSAKFEGGFLDGVSLEFSPNLNCIIGGRGSGKSTALVSIRAALNQPTDEDPDALDRMPDTTTVTFVDRAGSERTAVRRRGERPKEPLSSTTIALPLADMGQDESGRLTENYETEPTRLLAFLDSFVSLASLEEREREILSALSGNTALVLRTNVDAEEITKTETLHQQLEASLQAAQTGKVEEIAKWAVILASQTPLLEQLEAAIEEASSIVDTTGAIDIDKLAAGFGADLTKKPAVTYVDGDEGLRVKLAGLNTRRAEILQETTVNLKGASADTRALLEGWKAEHEAILVRLDEKQRELSEKGLKVQAGAIRELLTRLNATKTKLRELRDKQRAQTLALKERDGLRQQLASSWDAIYQVRKLTLKRIADAANAASDELRIHVYFEHHGMDRVWCEWLSSKFTFRTPRVQRLAAMITPGEFADKLLLSPVDLLALKDSDGQPFFTQQTLLEGLPRTRGWDELFKLHTMRREDRPRVEVQEPGSSERKPLHQLSAGQQRSIVLSIILSAEQDDPLVLDQPEDHLDARYIATAVVRHLEAAKERRQVILATHSANLTVLGDAELAIPLCVEGGRGKPHDPGAIDRPATRDQVCSLLEGGVDAYRRRGERYGFRFQSSPEPKT